MEQQQIRRGVVLGGGGSKGAYEVGVWQALEELSIEYHVVVGTSVGALNGAMMAQGDLEETLHLWRTVDNSIVMGDVPKYASGVGDKLEMYRSFAKQIVANGGIDIAPMENRLRQVVDENLIRNSKVEFGLVTVDMRTFKSIEVFVTDIPQGKLHDFILASATCFPAFKPRDIDGKIYVDGGFRNNIPISLVLQSKQKLDEIIVVDVNGAGKTKLVETDIPIRYISTYWDLGNMLTFDSTIARRNITLGYNDTMKEFDQNDGEAYTFIKGEMEIFEQLHLKDFSKVFLQIMRHMSDNEKTIINTIITNRVMDTATRRRKGTGKYRLQDFMLTIAELAAEILGIEPTNIYKIEDFDSRVVTRYRELVAETMVAYPFIFGEDKINIISVVKNLKREQLVVATRYYMHHCLLGNNHYVTLELLATICPKEFLAAIYLELLMNDLLYLV